MASDPLGLGLDNIFSRLGDSEELTRLRSAYDDLRARCLTAEGKLARIDSLCRDPAESHRMITRKELGKIIRGE